MVKFSDPIVAVGCGTDLCSNYYILISKYVCRGRETYQCAKHPSLLASAPNSLVRGDCSKFPIALPLPYSPFLFYTHDTDTADR